jgi:hypothetical protein
LTRRLLLDDTLDMDDVLKTVDRSDLSLATLVGTTNYGNLVVLSDWDGSNLVEKLGLWYKRWRLAAQTLYFSRSSLLNGALMMVRLTLDGAS